MNQELLIQKYFRGTLTSEEQANFEQLMDSDPSFAKEVSAYRDVQKAIKESERVALKSQLIQIEQKISEPKPMGKKRRLWPLAIAAAIATLLAIAGIFYGSRTNSAMELYAANFEPYPNALEPIKRGQETTSLDVQAFLAYEEGKYELATKKFETLLTEKDSSNIRFYYAMSLLNAEKLDLALNQLKQIDEKTNRFQPQIEWYLGLIYVQKEEWQKARERLENLTNLETPYKQSEVQKLLAKFPN